MFSKLLVALLVIAATMGVPGVGNTLEYIAPTSSEETITVSTLPLGITSSVCIDASGRRQPAIIQVNADAIYFSLHSSSATPDSGDFKAAVGTTIKLSPLEVRKLRMIRVTTDASVKVQCYS